MMRSNKWARDISFRSTLSFLLSLFVVCCAGTSKNGQTESKINLLEDVEIVEKEPLPPEFEVTDRVEVKTSMGSIIIGLYGKDAPKTVANFLAYVDSGHYEGTIFHRVIEQFMIQGGGFDVDLKYKRTELPVELEVIPGLKHVAGIVSMARTTDPDSGSSQFFICVGPAPQLNGTYAAFGKVEQGMDIALAISKVATRTVKTETNSMSDVPVEPVFIEKVARL